MKNILRIHLAVISQNALVFQSFADLETGKNNHEKIDIIADFISIEKSETFYSWATIKMTHADAIF